MHHPTTLPPRVRPTHPPHHLLLLAIAAGLAPAAAASEPARSGAWLHPAGMVSRQTVAEMREKCRRYPWARAVRDGILREVQPWVEIPMERLRALTPRQRANVYHNFTCPDDHATFTFEPFNDSEFTCPKCRKRFAASQASNVYPPGNAYHGTYHDGWACLYFISIAQSAWKMGLAYQLTGEERYARRAGEILLLYAEILPAMPRASVGGTPVIFTYNREGDVRLLEFAGAYELIRDSGVLTPEERRRVERDFLKPFCDDVFMDPELRTDWNNVYWWQLAIAQTGIALEDRHYLEYAFGLGDYSPQRRPQHRSLAYCCEHHFKPDGAYWGLNTGYQLYPITALLQTVALGANLARQEPGRFPAAEFDTTDPCHPIGAAARRAVRWYVSLALPDLTMATVGDSMYSRDSLKVYDPCAELAYRYFGVDEAAAYPEMAGSRGLWGLLWGAVEVRKRRVPFESARLSSGFTALRSEAGGKRLYVGLNHLLPGDGHQHSDRLGILTYACDRLLGLEKGTPYNNDAVREAGSSSWSHNTVTVDGASQKRGNQLAPAQVPEIRYFQADPLLQYAEVWGDRIYPQTTRYRRAVALVDDIVMDLFDVRGGKTQEWLYHCAGDDLSVGLPLQESAAFDTPAYVVGGWPRCRHARADGTWNAEWHLPADPGSPYAGRREPVTHRLTMVGCPGTEVYALKTYPAQRSPVGAGGFTGNLTGRKLGKAVAPPAGDGLTNTLLARRTGGGSAFVALLDTYADRPSLLEAHAIPTDRPEAVALAWSTREGRRLLVYNPEPETPVSWNEGGIAGRLMGHFVLVRLSPRGDVAGIALLGATELRFGDVAVTLERPANLFLSCGGRMAARTAADLAYETVGGQKVFAPCPEAAAEVSRLGRTRRVTAQYHR